MSFHTAARTSPPNSFLLSAMKSCLMMRPKWRRQMSSFPLTWPDFLKRPPAVLRIPQVPGAKQNSAVIRRGVRGRCPYTEWMFTSLSRTCCHCVLHLCLKVSVGTKKNQKKVMTVRLLFKRKCPDGCEWSHLKCQHAMLLQTFPLMSNLWSEMI